MLQMSRQLIAEGVWISSTKLNTALSKQLAEARFFRYNLVHCPFLDRWLVVSLGYCIPTWHNFP